MESPHTADAVPVRPASVPGLEEYQTRGKALAGSFRPPDEVLADRCRSTTLFQCHPAIDSCCIWRETPGRWCVSAPWRPWTRACAIKSRQQMLGSTLRRQPWRRAMWRTTGGIVATSAGWLGQPPLAGEDNDPGW